MERAPAFELFSRLVPRCVWFHGWIDRVLFCFEYFFFAHLWRLQYVLRIHRFDSIYGWRSTETLVAHSRCELMTISRADVAAAAAAAAGRSGSGDAAASAAIHAAMVRLRDAW